MKPAKRYTEEVKSIIFSELEKSSIKCKVEGRAKHLYSIYKKMHEQHINFDEVYDLIAFRIILDSDQEKTCYEALSMVHALWKPVPGRFKDYIAMPRPIIINRCIPRLSGHTEKEWKFRSGLKQCMNGRKKALPPTGAIRKALPSKNSEENQIKKLREVMEIQHEIKDPKEFMSNLKLALFPEEVYVFTPNGDVKSFPKGATH